MSNLTHEEDDMYAIKRVWFGVMRVGVVTQEDNGPCPIIAIANTLLLRGAISLPSTQSAISHRGLVKLLADYARDINRVPPGCEHGGMSAEIAANIEANLASSMHVLNGRAMRYGMDINCSLTSVSGFEFTEEIGVFDLFRIRPLHGWIASPDEEELHDFFSGRSYNQVQDAIAHLQESLERSAGSTISQDDSEEDEICAGPLPSSRSSHCINSIFDTGTASQAALARAWFAENPTQLTRYGLKCLKRTMGESEICVLFRNNHYNTVMKQNGQLYTLVSAAGFLQCPRFVFQKLTPAGADIEAFDGSFVRLREIYPSTELMPATGAAFAADNAADCEVMPGRKRNVGRILAGTPGGSTAGPSSAGPSRAGPSRAGPRRASGSKAGNSGRPPQESERRRRRLKQEEIDRRYAKRVQAIYDAQNSEKLPIVGQTARQHEPSSALESCVLM